MKATFRELNPALTNVVPMVYVIELERLKIMPNLTLQCRNIKFFIIINILHLRNVKAGLRHVNK